MKIFLERPFLRVILRVIVIVKGWRALILEGSRR